MTAEAKLYEALILVCKDRHEELDMSGTAAVEIPLKSGETLSLPTLFLENME